MWKNNIIWAPEYQGSSASSEVMLSKNNQALHYPEERPLWYMVQEHEHCILHVQVSQMLRIGLLDVK